MHRIQRFSFFDVAFAFGYFNSQWQFNEHSVVSFTCFPLRHHWALPNCRSGWSRGYLICFCVLCLWRLCLVSWLLYEKCASTHTTIGDRTNGISHFSLLLTFRSSSSRTMDDKKQYLSASGYNLHGSSYSINLPAGGGTASGYRGSNEFIRKLSFLNLRRWHIKKIFY